MIDDDWIEAAAREYCRLSREPEESWRERVPIVRRLWIDRAALAAGDAAKKSRPAVAYFTGPARCQCALCEGRAFT